MRKSKLCILACCVGLSGATFLAIPANAQSDKAAGAASSADDQTKALEALRKAEAGPVVPDVGVNPAPAPQPEAATPAPSIVAPTPSVTATPGSDDQTKALNAVRSEEARPMPSATPVHSGPLTTREREALLVEAQRQRKMAEEKAMADRAAMDENAKRQRAEDDARIKEAMEKSKADLAAQEVAAREQQTVDDERIKQAVEAERAAAEQLRLARAEEAAAAERERLAKARAEAAERARIAQAQADAERLKKQMGASAATAPLGEIPAGPPSAKEQRLADLLRRYQADQITPYEYHVQRAKIIAEP